MKCKRCKYLWLPCGTREVRDTLYMTDVGICPVCKSAKARLRTATAGQVVSAMLWGRRFEGLSRNEEKPV